MSWCRTRSGAPAPPRVTCIVVPATGTFSDVQALGLTAARAPPSSPRAGGEGVSTRLPAPPGSLQGPPESPSTDVLVSGRHADDGARYHADCFRPPVPGGTGGHAGRLHHPGRDRAPDPVARHHGRQDPG